MIEERKSQVSVNLPARQHEYIAQQEISLSEWVRILLDREIFDKKLFQFTKKSKLPLDFFEKYEIVKNSPSFELVHETQQDENGRVKGHGFFPRMKRLTPEANKKIEAGFVIAKQKKTGFAWRIPVERGVNVILEDFMIFDKFSQLENGQLLYEGDPIPYDIRPTAEFIEKERLKREAENIKIENERNQQYLASLQKSKDIDRIKTELAEIEYHKRQKEKVSELNPTSVISPTEDIQNEN